MFGNKRKKKAKYLLSLAKECLRNLERFHSLTPDETKKETLSYFIESRKKNISEYAEIVGNPDAFTIGLEALMDPLKYYEIKEKALLVEIKKYKQGDDQFIEHLNAIKTS